MIVFHPDPSRTNPHTAAHSSAQSACCNPRNRKPAGWQTLSGAGMIRLLLPLALLPLLGGCLVATVAGVAVGAAKTTAKAAGTVVETAVDATTQTSQEADEDRGKAIRLDEKAKRKEAGRQQKEAERLQREAEHESPPTPDALHSSGYQ